MRLSLCRLVTLLLSAGALWLDGCAPASIPPTLTPLPVTPTASSSPAPVDTGTPVSPSAPSSPTTPPAVASSPTPAPTNTALPTAVPTASPTTTPAGDPARGAQLFATLPCTSCHDVTHPFPGGAICPNLGNISAEAARIVKSPDYHGKATDAAGYIRESIMNPNAYIVPGAQYRQADGQSLMPKNFAQILTPQQIDDLVAYLMTQSNGALPTPTASGQ